MFSYSKFREEGIFFVISYVFQIKIDWKRNFFNRKPIAIRDSQLRTQDIFCITYAMVTGRSTSNKTASSFIKLYP